jgi:hypothetical protein
LPLDRCCSFRSNVVPLQGLRHDRNTAISDMKRERPFPVIGNNGTLKRQGFPLTVSETLGKEALGLKAVHRRGHRRKPFLFSSRLTIVADPRASRRRIAPRGSGLSVPVCLSSGSDRNFPQADLSVPISQACLSRHLSEMMDRIAKGPEDVKKSVRAAGELS